MSFLCTPKKKKNESQNQLRRMFENHKIIVLTRNTESFLQQTLNPLLSCCCFARPKSDTIKKKKSNFIIFSKSQHCSLAFNILQKTKQQQTITVHKRKFFLFFPVKMPHVQYSEPFPVFINGVHTLCNCAICIDIMRFISENIKISLAD